MTGFSTCAADSPVLFYSTIFFTACKGIKGGIRELFDKLLPSDLTDKALSGTIENKKCRALPGGTCERGLISHVTRSGRFIHSHRRPHPAVPCGRLHLRRRRGRCGLSLSGAGQKGGGGRGCQGPKAAEAGGLAESRGLSPADRAAALWPAGAGAFPLHLWRAGRGAALPYRPRGGPGTAGVFSPLHPLLSGLFPFRRPAPQKERPAQRPRLCPALCRAAVLFAGGGFSFLKALRADCQRHSAAVPH